MTVRRAALAAVLAGLSGCCDCQRSPDFAVRPAARAPAAAPLSSPARALHFADFGDDTCQQQAIAAALLAAHRRAPFDLVLSAGDNLYECGPDPRLPGAEACDFAADGSTAAAGYLPPPDPTFALFEKPLAALSRGPRPLAVHLALGNHDVAAWAGCGAGLPPKTVSRRRACLEVAHRSPLWAMPGRHYALDLGPARVIVLDSNLLFGDYGGFTLDAEVAFLRAAAQGCDARPCFAVGHHPPATAGGHSDELDAAYLGRLALLEAAAGGRLAAWLAGHDHDLQHVRAAAGYDVFVSGNGSRGRPFERFEVVAPSGASLLFASVSWGHGVLEVGPEGWSYRFENDRGEPLHCCDARGGGRCQPVVCR